MAELREPGDATPVPAERRGQLPSTPTTYRGQDRRAAPAAAPAQGGSGRRLLLAAAIPAAVAAAASSHLDPAAAAGLRDTAAALTAGLLGGAAALLGIHWRLTGSAVSALCGLALLVLGGLALPAQLLAPVLSAAGSDGLAAPLARAAAAGAAVVLLVRAARSPDVVADLRPGRLLLRVGLAVGSAALVAVPLASAWPDAAAAGVPALLDAALCVAWLLAARRLHARDDDVTKGWAGCSLLLLAGGAGCRALAESDLQSWSAAAATLEVAAGGVALAGAARALNAVLTGHGSDLLRLTVDLDRAETRHSSEAELRQERLHDVRSVLAALRCATGTLRRYEDRLDPGVRRRLEDAVTAELGRLEHLVDPRLREEATELDLAEVLRPVMVAERAMGTEVDDRLPSLAVRARPHDVATIMANLLVNARRHAPGSPVTVSGHPVGEAVSVRVSDTGPGVPVAERDSVFERGRRGRASASTEGSGLGLHTARRLAEELGGSLTVGDGPDGGACFVLTLPTA